MHGHCEMPSGRPSAHWYQGFGHKAHHPIVPPIHTHFRHCSTFTQHFVTPPFIFQAFAGNEGVALRWGALVLGGSVGSEAVLIVWSCLDCCCRQFCWHVDRSIITIQGLCMLSQDSRQIRPTHCGLRYGSYGCVVVCRSGGCCGRIDSCSGCVSWCGNGSCCSLVGSLL